MLQDPREVPREQPECRGGRTEAADLGAAGPRGPVRYHSPGHRGGHQAYAGLQVAASSGPNGFKNNILRNSCYLLVETYDCLTLGYLDKIYILFNAI